MHFFFQRRVLAWIAAIEAGLLVAQVFIFYPCLTNEAAAHEIKTREARDQQQPLAPSLQDADHLDVQKDDRPVHVFEQPPFKTPEDIKRESVAGIPPPKNMPSNSPKQNYKPTWESLESRPIPDWYLDAKVGIFIHWGVYSVPSFVEVGSKGLSEWFWWNWQGTIDKNHTAAHRSVIDYMKKTHPPNWQYSDFAPQFTAEFYDPDHWAKLFEKSGAKYVVLTSKHHDGFTLWGSKRAWNWNAVDNGPHRDVLGDLVKAIRKNTDLHFGTYHSLYEWFNPLYLEDKKNNFKTQNYIKTKMLPEILDLVNTYKPEILWSDGQWEAPCAYWNCTEIIAWLYNESPVRDIVVTNDRWGKETSCKHGGFLSCDDRHNPQKKMTRKWENCMTIDKESWGYRRNAHSVDYYNMDELTEILAQTISYGGNLLMNVGPTADGRIAPLFEERLLELGRWLQVNGEAVYTTREWTHPRDSKNQQVYYTKAKDNSAVYAIVLEWPEDDVLALGSPQPGKSTEVTWLGYSGAIEWKRSGDGMTITMPQISMSKIPCQYAWVFKLTNLGNVK